MNIHGYKQSKKGMTQNIRHTENSIDEESHKRNPNKEKIVNLKNKLERLVKAKQDCSERIIKLKKERDKK